MRIFLFVLLGGISDKDILIFIDLLPLSDVDFLLLLGILFVFFLKLLPAMALFLSKDDSHGFFIKRGPSYIVDEAGLSCLRAQIDSPHLEVIFLARLFIAL